MCLYKTELFEIELIICIRMDLAVNNLQRLVCYKNPTNQSTNKSTNQPINQPINQSTNQSTNQATNQSTNQPTFIEQDVYSANFEKQFENYKIKYIKTPLSYKIQFI